MLRGKKITTFHEKVLIYFLQTGLAAHSQKQNPQIAF